MAFEGSFGETWQAVQALLSRPGVPISNVHAEQIQTFLNIANRWLLGELAANHVSDALFTGTHVVSTGVTAVPFSGINAVMMTPQKLWERVGSVEQWQPMEFRHPLPVNARQGRRLRWWDIGNAGDVGAVLALLFVGALSDVNIRFTYIGRVQEHIADPREAASVIDSTDILAAYVAYLFCTSMQTPQGRASAADFLQMAHVRLDNFIRRDTKLWQNRPVRSRRARFGLTQRRGF